MDFVPRLQATPITLQTSLHLLSFAVSGKRASDGALIGISAAPGLRLSGSSPLRNKGETWPKAYSPITPKDTCACMGKQPYLYPRGGTKEATFGKFGEGLLIHAMDGSASICAAEYAWHGKGAIDSF